MFFCYVVIPLTHHKNSSYTEFKVLGVYLSPACGGGKITSTQFFLIDKGILQWCVKGITIICLFVIFDNVFIINYFQPLVKQDYI